MMKVWKIKVLALGCLLALAAAVPVRAAEKPGPAVGRYQVVISGDRTSYALVIDTVTGQVWEKNGPDFKKQKAADAGKPNGPVGRYQVVISGDRTYYALVIDTITGQVWERSDPEFKKKKN
jgi:hypothetical protein